MKLLIRNNTVLYHFRHLSSIQQSMAYWTFLILKSYVYSRHFLIKVEIEYRELSPVNVGVPQGSVLGLIPAIHCRPANLNRIYHSNLCRRYCSSGYGQWSSHCVTQTTNQPSCKPKLVLKNGEWKLMDPHKPKSAPSPRPYKQCATPPRWEDLLGTKAFSQNGNNSESPSAKCIGYSDESQNSLQIRNFSYIKQYSNQSGLMEYNSGVRLPLPT
jgi:hypothetical protein